ncbi:MAG: GNAT family N-acetyltransferase [Thiohalocapsa sp.]
MQIDDRTVQLLWRHFSDFSAGELYEMLRFRQAIFVVEQASPYPDLDGLDQSAHHLLLQIDATLAGYLRLIPALGEKRVTVGRVAVARAHRRHGLARLMVKEALVRCRRYCAHGTVALSAQIYLLPFYESLGFHPTSAPYDDYGVAHIDMTLR